MKKIWAIFYARNLEFIRDRSSLGWTFIFPIFILIGFSFIFDRDMESQQFKIGLLNPPKQELQSKITQMKYFKFIEFKTKKEAMDKLSHHKIDFVIDPSTQPISYWVSETSPNGKLAERLWLFEVNAPPDHQFSDWNRQPIESKEVPYLDWLFPGILGMNIMFNAIFGVGYVIVHYRKNGVLKRLSVTPLKSYEFLIAQISSRIFLIIFTTLILYIGCVFMFSFQNHGSYLALFIIFIFGSISMIAMGLLVATRTTSEELAGGLLNLMSWPMMVFSEVWFSLEGSPEWIQNASLLFPLTHLVKASRSIMNDGATLGQVGFHFWALVGMSIVFLGIGSALFKWESE